MNRGLARGWPVEPALVALTVVVVAGMTRLFADATFLGDTLALALLSHLAATTARRAGLGVMASAVASAAVGVLAVTALLYPDTASYLVLPASSTVDAVRADLNEAWAIFNEESAPVPVATGFVVAAGALLWVLVFVADWAAHRLGSAVEAVLPAFMIFVFTVVLGTDEGALGHAVAFSAAAMAVMLTMRAAGQARRAWIEPGPGRGAATVLRCGAGAGAVAVLAGAVIGPSLPGAGAEALIDLTDLEPGPQRRVVVSPLVQVRARLVEQSDVELFSVAVDSDSREYWRLMALDEFDGNLWRARSSFDEATGPLPSDFDPSVTARPLTQAVTIENLGNIFLPAAHEVREVIDDGGVAMEYEPASGSLVKTRSGDALGPRRFTYVVESSVPEIDARRLRSPAGSSTGDFVAFNTALPSAFPAAVRAEAERAAGGAGTDYDRALALQDYFRDPDRFRYDLNVAFDQDLDDLEAFLFDVRAGYCEQFASAFAAMARSIGLPARVAVGFTWGEWDDARGAYAVRGEHAHAWPEVYFAGTGWVRFEPTPGRGGPNDYGVTGVPPAQEGSQPSPATATTVPAQSGSELAGTGGGSAPPAPTAPAAPDSRPRSDQRPRLWPALVYAGAAAAGAAGAVPGLRLLQRRRWRARAAHDPAGLMELAWRDALDALALVDVRHRRWESPLELAARAGRRVDAGPVETLARCVTLGRYSPHVPEPVADRAEASARAVAQSCRRRSSRRRRLAAFFDPRTLLNRQP